MEDIVPVCHEEFLWSGRKHKLVQKRICVCNYATIPLSGVWPWIYIVYNVYNVYGALCPFTANLVQQEPLH